MTDDRTLSAEHQRDGDAKHPKDALDRDQARGERAFIADNGEARGSGSGAGGGNPGEDYDDDAASGGGDLDSQQKAVENQGSVKPEDYPEPARG